MKLVIKKHKISLSLFLILVGFFFIPFNSGINIPFFGEFSRESCVLFFLASGLVTLFEILFKKKIYFPKSHFLIHLIFLFIIWIIVSFFVNFNDIQGYELKNTSGLKRFFSQITSLIISISFFIFYYNAFRSESIWTLLRLIRRAFLLGFAFVSIYVLLETLIVKLKFSFLQNLLYLFDYFPFTDVNLDLGLYRISGPTFEPPSFATYLITVTPWMLSYIITHKTILKYIPSVLVLTFGLLSGSRAGIFIITIQFIVFFSCFLNFKKYQTYLIKLLFFGGIAALLIFAFKGRTITNYIAEKATSFNIEGDQHSISNKSRFGIQYANYEVFKKNPFFGVGFGQQSFEAKKYYPRWSIKDNWEFRLKYLNDNHPSFVPGYNLYIRLLAETGFIGLIIFLAILILSITMCLIAIYQKNKNHLIYLIVLTSLIGTGLNWLKVDSFRDYIFWINLALLIILTSSLSKSKILKNIESQNL